MGLVVVNGTLEYLKERVRTLGLDKDPSVAGWLDMMRSRHRSDRDSAERSLRARFQSETERQAREATERETAERAKRPRARSMMDPSTRAAWDGFASTADAAALTIRGER